MFHGLSNGCLNVRKKPVGVDRRAAERQTCSHLRGNCRSSSCVIFLTPHKSELEQRSLRFWWFFFLFLNTSESNEDEWKSNRAFWLLHLIEIASVQIQQSDARCQRWHPRLHNILKVWNKFWLFLLMLTESLAPQRSPLLLEHLYERLHLQFQGFLNWRQTTFYFNLSFRLSVRYPVCRWAQGRSKSVTVGASDIMTSFIHSNGRDILYLLSATTNGERFVRQPTANLNTNILQVKADPATEVSNSDEVKRERNSPRTP